MKLQIVAIRDQQLDAYMRPFFVQTIGQAKRMFGDEATRISQDPSNPNPIQQHPEDYALFHIGTFDDNTGKLDQPPQPQQIALATEFKL